MKDLIFSNQSFVTHKDGGTGNQKNAQNLSKSVKSNLCFVVALRIRLNMNLVYITKRCLKTDNTISNHSKLADEVRTRTEGS